MQTLIEKNIQIDLRMNTNTGMWIDVHTDRPADGHVYLDIDRKTTAFTHTHTHTHIHTHTHYTYAHTLPIFYFGIWRSFTFILYFRVSCTSKNIDFCKLLNFCARKVKYRTLVACLS